MKELKVDTISLYQYTMVQSSKPRYFLGSVLAVAIVSFGCGAILGLLSSEIVVETNIIHEETKLASALPEKDNESSKLAWLVSVDIPGTPYITVSFFYTHLSFILPDVFPKQWHKLHWRLDKRSDKDE